MGRAGHHDRDYQGRAWEAGQHCRQHHQGYSRESMGKQVHEGREPPTKWSTAKKVRPKMQQNTANTTQHIVDVIAGTRESTLAGWVHGWVGRWVGDRMTRWVIGWVDGIVHESVSEWALE